MEKKIKVLIVEDSYLVTTLLEDLLLLDSQIEIIGFAKDGKEGVKCAKELSPDIIIMDIDMPNMNGIEATEKIMTEHPCPILIFTSALVNNTHKEFEILSKGALGIIEKPDITNYKKIADELIQQIKILSGVKVIKRHKPRDQSEKISVKETKKVKQKKEKNISIIGIASSTGGPGILKRIFIKLPKNFLPIVVIQHINENFVGGLINWLNNYSENIVKEAKDNEKLERGFIYFSPAEYHLCIDKKGRIRYNNDRPINHIKPSADILFNSIADVYGDKSIGII